MLLHTTAHEPKKTYFRLRFVMSIPNPLITKPNALIRDPIYSRYCSE